MEVRESHCVGIFSVAVYVFLLLVFSTSGKKRLSTSNITSVELTVYLLYTFLIVDGYTCEWLSNYPRKTPFCFTSTRVNHVMFSVRFSWQIVHGVSYPLRHNEDAGICGRYSRGFAVISWHCNFEDSCHSVNWRYPWSRVRELRLEFPGEHLHSSSVFFTYSETHGIYGTYLYTGLGTGSVLKFSSERLYFRHYTKTCLILSTWSRSSLFEDSLFCWICARLSVLSECDQFWLFAVNN